MTEQELHMSLKHCCKIVSCDINHEGGLSQQRFPPLVVYNASSYEVMVDVSYWML